MAAVPQSRSDLHSSTRPLRREEIAVLKEFVRPDQRQPDLIKDQAVARGIICGLLVSFVLWSGALGAIFIFVL
jgi:hypothetical protein